MSPRALAVAALVAGSLACGTRVVLLGDEAVRPDAGLDPKCETMTGALGKPCVMCLFADGRILGDCKDQQLPVALPPCPANTGPLDGKCERCARITVPDKGVTTTCLVCKDWLKDPTSVCRTCFWPALPPEFLCQQCMDPNGTVADSCDAILQKAQLVP